MADTTTNQNQNTIPTATPVASPVTPQASQGTMVKGDNIPAGKLDTQHPEDLDMTWNKWKCLECSYVYEGVKPLMKCPRCGNENPDRFQDMD